MSLAIDIDEVAAVLLHDGWHDVLDISFVLDSYEFIWMPKEAAKLLAERFGVDFDEETKALGHLVHPGGASNICLTGFTFKSSLGQLAGPLTSILAVRYVPS